LSEDIDYVTHAGRELELMLEGSKPLAMFYLDADEDEIEDFFPKSKFDQCINNGLLVGRECIITMDLSSTLGKIIRIRYFFYAKIGEEWRIDAMILLIHTENRLTIYDEGLDMMMGSLLGYSDEENDRYQALRK
jgi:hypothetical protein